MQHGMAKALALKSIAMGLKAPEGQIDRFVELTHLSDLLRSLDINCVLDVGANRGQFAHELRGIGYAGHIVSFEPVQREFDVLSRSFAGDAKWKGLRMALGSEDSTMTMHVPPLSVLSSLLTPLHEAPGTVAEQVDVRRLDGLFATLVRDIDAPRVFLKMDTQGFDVSVFKGAAGCIDHVLGLQSELSVKPLYESMPHYLEALGTYEAAGMQLHNLSVVARDSNGGVVELNCFMRRP